MRTTTEILRSLLGAGLSQSEIARRTGIPQPRLSRWAAGDTPVSADDALRLVDLQESMRTQTDPAGRPLADVAQAA